MQMYKSSVRFFISLFTKRAAKITNGVEVAVMPTGDSNVIEGTGECGKDVELGVVKVREMQIGSDLMTGSNKSCTSCGKCKTPCSKTFSPETMFPLERQPFPCTGKTDGTYPCVWAQGPLSRCSLSGCPSPCWGRA